VLPSEPAKTAVKLYKRGELPSILRATVFRELSGPDAAAGGSCSLSTTQSQIPPPKTVRLSDHALMLQN
jgi:hypothetical protein